MTANSPISPSCPDRLLTLVEGREYHEGATTSPTTRCLRFRVARWIAGPGPVCLVKSRGTADGIAAAQPTAGVDAQRGCTVGVGTQSRVGYLPTQPRHRRCCCSDCSAVSVQPDCPRLCLVWQRPGGCRCNQPCV